MDNSSSKYDLTRVERGKTYLTLLTQDSNKSDQNISFETEINCFWKPNSKKTFCGSNSQQVDKVSNFFKHFLNIYGNFPKKVVLALVEHAIMHATFSLSRNKVYIDLRPGLIKIKYPGIFSNYDTPLVQSTLIDELSWTKNKFSVAIKECHDLGAKTPTVTQRNGWITFTVFPGPKYSPVYITNYTLHKSESNKQRNIKITLLSREKQTKDFTALLMQIFGNTPIDSHKNINPETESISEKSKAIEEITLIQKCNRYVRSLIEEKNNQLEKHSHREILKIRKKLFSPKIILFVAPPIIEDWDILIVKSCIERIFLKSPLFNDDLFLNNWFYDYKKESYNRINRLTTTINEIYKLLDTYNECLPPFNSIKNPVPQTNKQKWSIITFKGNTETATDRWRSKRQLLLNIDKSKISDFLKPGDEHRDIKPEMNYSKFKNVSMDEPAHYIKGSSIKGIIRSELNKFLNLEISSSLILPTSVKPKPGLQPLEKKHFRINLCNLNTYCWQKTLQNRESDVVFWRGKRALNIRAVNTGKRPGIIPEKVIKFLNEAHSKRNTGTKINEINKTTLKYGIELKRIYGITPQPKLTIEVYQTNKDEYKSYLLFFTENHAQNLSNTLLLIFWYQQPLM